MRSKVNKLEKLYKQTDRVDYDMEAYSNSLADSLHQFPSPDTLKG